jgi:extradiol dioxygenase
MLQLNSLDDVGATLDICQQRGVPLELSLGRHTNDRMLSFYVRTPSGFSVEYGWGARTVDDREWLYNFIAPAASGDIIGRAPERRRR